MNLDFDFQAMLFISWSDIGHAVHVKKYFF